MARFPDWATLDGGLVDAILSKLFYLSDYIRFGAVCKSWHSVAVDQRQKRMETMHKQPPMVLNCVRFEQEYPMSPDIRIVFMNPSHRITEDMENRYQPSKLYSITENRIYNHQFQVPCLPTPMGYSFDSAPFFCSSYGWLITYNFRFQKVVDQLEKVVDLFNPFTQKTITIPCDSLNRFQKIILSCNPTTCPTDFVIGAICCKERHKTLAFRKAGQDSWAFTNILDFDYHDMEDIIFHKGLLYVVGRKKRLIAIHYKNIINGDGDQLAVTPIVEIVPESSSLDRRFYNPFEAPELVETSNGELLLVEKYLKEYGKPLFHVYKLGKKEKEIKSSFDKEEKFGWVAVSELEDNDTIFISADYLRHTFVCASSVPNSNRNSIYLSRTSPYKYDPSLNEQPEGTHDTGRVQLYRLCDICVFDMKDKTLRDLGYEFNVGIWITPTLC